MDLMPAILLLVALLARELAFQRERQDNLQQTQDLLQRIQAPSVAVMSHATEQEHVSVIGVPLMEDSDYEGLLNGD